VTILPIARLPRSSENESTPVLPSTHDQRRVVRVIWQLLLPLSVCTSSGCYDGDALLKQARSAALTTTLAEVDLGEFHTTLPRDPKTGAFTSIDMHIFGTVPRTRLAAVERQLGTDEYRMRQETLTAVRQCKGDELTDPAFSTLRARIVEVVNKVLTDAPVDGIGFYQLTLR
jgi:hypothetical protein